jgi:hypothetical protein
MEKTMNPWPHKWFGYWKEYGPEYALCPSISEWIYPKEYNPYGEDLPRIIEYLRTATIIAVTSCWSFPHPFGQQYKNMSMWERTDGVWEWLDIQADFVERNHVAIPAEFYTHMKANSFIPPDVSDMDFSFLDHPE